MTSGKINCGSQSRCRKMIFGAAAVGVFGGLALASAPAAYALTTYDFTSLNSTLPGSDFAAYAYGINNADTIVGRGSIGTATTQAYSYSGGTITNLGNLGGHGSRSAGYAINDFGEVVGRSYTSTSSGNYHAFSYTSSGGIKDLGTLGGIASYATGINDSGTIVGTSYILSGSSYHAFSYTSAGGRESGSEPGADGWDARPR